MDRGGKREAGCHRNGDENAVNDNAEQRGAERPLIDLTKLFGLIFVLTFFLTRIFTSGLLATTPTPVKSLTESYGSFEYSAALTAKAAELTRSV